MSERETMGLPGAPGSPVAPTGLESGQGASVEEKARLVGELFTLYGEKYIELMNYYLSDVGEGWEEREIEMADEEADLMCWVEDELAKLSLRVKFQVDGDSCCYFNAPGYPRAYNYYHVEEIHDVIDEELKKVYVVAVSYNKLCKPWRTEYIFNCVDVRVVEAVGDDTPLADKFSHYIPWPLIRDEWRYNIEKFVEEVARAEREGRLEEAVREVASRLRSGSWIYDYAHTLGALKKACGELNVKLPEA